VSDSNSHNPQTSLAILLAKVVGGKGKSQLPILYEVVKSNTTFTLAATVQHAKVSLENILKITNTFYRRVLEEDRKEWKNEPVTSPIPKGTLLRLGQGATAYSTSFLILAKDIGLDSEYQRVTRVHPPKTRKRLEGGHPSFGWVEIS
ncbi:MAG: hypothetical protein N3A72_01670, partial [bacterium]|nr:hypothetical protein [bacterium]